MRHFHRRPRAMLSATAVLILAATIGAARSAEAQERMAAFSTAHLATALPATTPFAIPARATAAVEGMRAYPPTHWQEGMLIGGVITGLLLWRSRALELPGAIVLLPLGATIGALVGGQFPKDEPPEQQRSSQL
jgi:hypothetical protein